jgi:hypothetical protein
MGEAAHRPKYLVATAHSHLLTCKKVTEGGEEKKKNTKRRCSRRYLKWY